MDSVFPLDQSLQMQLKRESSWSARRQISNGANGAWNRLHMRKLWQVKVSRKSRAKWKKSKSNNQWSKSKSIVWCQQDMCHPENAPFFQVNVIELSDVSRYDWLIWANLELTCGSPYFFPVWPCLQKYEGQGGSNPWPLELLSFHWSSNTRWVNTSISFWIKGIYINVVINYIS